MALPTWDELSKEFRDASGPSRALDCRLWLAIGDQQVRVHDDDEGKFPRSSKLVSAREFYAHYPYWDDKHQVHALALEVGAPALTESADAILALLPDQGIEVSRYWRKVPGVWWSAHLSWDMGDAVTVMDMPSLPLALCLALIEMEKAKASG